MLTCEDLGPVLQACSFLILLTWVYQIKFPSLVMQEVRSIRKIKRFKDYVAESTKEFWCLNDLINDSI